MRLIQNLLNRQEFDDSLGSFVKRGAFVVGVFGVAEADKESALSAVFAFAFHDGLERVDAGSADFVRVTKVLRVDPDRPSESILDYLSVL